MQSTSETLLTNTADRRTGAGARLTTLSPASADRGALHPEPMTPMATNDHFVYDVFISYSPDDSAWVRGTLLPRLEADGLRVCIDFRDFVLGAPSISEMERAVLTSRRTLLVLTPSYLNGVWGAFQTFLLQTLDPANRERRLIPLRKARCELPLHIKFLIDVDFTDPQGQDFAWRRLLSGLGATVEPTPTAFPPRPRSDYYEHLKYPPHYLPRQELIEQVRQPLVAGTGHAALTSAVQADALHGMGGIGKTVMARALCDDPVVRARFADSILVAATLYGSYASGTADAHSDLDLGLITTDADFADFYAGRADWLRQLGEPLFLEDFGSAVSLLFILADGTEGELSVGRAGDFTHIHGEPHQVLLDKSQLLTECVFAQPVPGPAAQRATLQRLLDWFWHDFSHLVTALGRGQLWWAQGQIEVLRLMCVNLARLRHNFADPYVDNADYFKVDLAIPTEQQAALATTFCPLEASALLQAGHQILRFYQQIASPLAQAHGIVYPAELERVLVARLAKL